MSVCTSAGGLQTVAKCSGVWIKQCIDKKVYIYIKRCFIIMWLYKDSTLYIECCLLLLKEQQCNQNVMHCFFYTINTTFIVLIGVCVFNRLIPGYSLIYLFNIFSMLYSWLVAWSTGWFLIFQKKWRSRSKENITWLKKL